MERKIFGLLSMSPIELKNWLAQSKLSTDGPYKTEPQNCKKYI
jgi:hypothetical protein